MIYLDLPPQTQQVIEQIAQKNGQSIQDFITISAYEKALQALVEPTEPTEQIIQKKGETLLDFIYQFPKSQLTRSGLDIKKELRNEWD